ncbi:hypothetical protein MY4038_000644 [Beauveria bassiana]
MYSDRDGTATKQSQSAYDSRVRYLRLATSVLVSIGFGAAIADGEYGRAIIQWPADPVWALHWDRLLWPILWLHTISLYMQQDAISTHHSALRGALMSSVLIVFRLLSNSPDRETSEVALLVPLQLFCAILCVLVQLSIPRRPQLFTNKGHAVDAESSSSVLVRYSMFCCHAALDIASKSDTLSTMPVLNYETRASSQSVITVPSSRPYVWNRILDERFSTFVKQYIVVAMRAAFAFAPPYYLERLLQCLESPETVTSRAWMWFAGMGASAIVEAVASNHTAWTQMSEIGIPVKAQLIDSIFRKQLRKKDCREEKPVSKRASQVPDVINVVSADSNALSFYAAIAYILPFRLFKFLLAVLFLYWLLGWQSTLAAVVATLACFSAHRSTVKQTNAARKTLRSSRDRTTAILKEAFVSLREIKFSSLESQWESHIDAVREQELRDLSWSRTAVTIRGIWDTAGPFLVVIAALCAYMYTGGDITPSIVFPMINVLYQLQDTLSFVPTALNDYFHSIDTSGRIDTYLASAEQPLLVEPSPSGNIIFEDVTIAWPSDHVSEVGDDLESKTGPARFSLRDLNMEFPFGKLSIVSGKTGSGKSLLLAGILDEAELVQGHIEAPSAQGCPNSVAYVAQVPWLHSGTIQENILFGSPLDRERYNQVIAACALVPDFHALADGDQTQIGRRGVKLSGGQRTRVAFARALYSSAKTLILDDIFSTLDTQVSKEILCALTGEICKASLIDSAINVLTAICIGYTSIATILLVAWCSKLVSRYKKASAMVRRTDGGPMADILEHVTSTSAGIATIRAFGASNTYIEAMQCYLDAESTAKRHFYIFSRWLTLQMSLLGIVFAMITGVLLLTSESTNKVARVGFSLTFVMSLSNMISTTFSKFGYLELYMSSISSVMQYIEHDIEDPSGNDVAADWPSAGEIDVDDLQVGYSASLPPALKSVSFHVKRGEKVGIVGRTGAGKSSLTLSLLRLLNVQKGSISIDSIDISTIKVGDLRSRIGFIPQAPTLFCGTIRSNLDYFVQLSDGKINDALRHVGLLAEAGGADSGRFTAESPVAAGGENMSHGQRQLLCLARIILENPMVIILDEATSAVDGETDSMIQDIIRKLFHGTLIVVAHRLETIVSFDRILVMGDGTLLEDGTPKELLNRKGAFYSLVEESQNSSFLRKAILGR